MHISKCSGQDLEVADPKVTRATCLSRVLQTLMLLPPLHSTGLGQHLLTDQMPWRPWVSHSTYRYGWEAKESPAGMQLLTCPGAYTSEACRLDQLGC
jgi:hypothetical protein